jgi:hypothetical protein
MRVKKDAKKEFNSLLNRIIGNLYFIKGLSAGGLTGFLGADPKKTLAIILETTTMLINDYEKEKKK